MVDFLIENGLVYTMDPRRRIIDRGTVAIEGDKILDIGTGVELRTKYEVDQVIDAKGKAVARARMQH